MVLEGSDKGLYLSLKGRNYLYPQGVTVSWAANGKGGWATASAELEDLSSLARFFLCQGFREKDSPQWQTSEDFSTGLSFAANSTSAERIVVYVARPQWVRSVAGQSQGLCAAWAEEAAEPLTDQHLEQDPSEHPDVLRVCGADAVQLLAGLVGVLATGASECDATKSIRDARIKVGWGVGVCVLQMRLTSLCSRHTRMHPTPRLGLCIGLWAWAETENACGSCRTAGP